MFLGYYRNAEPPPPIMRDGWMHSGDAGYFNDNSSSWSSTASRISPRPRAASDSRRNIIENKLKFSPYVAEAVVLGDRPRLRSPR